MTVEHWIKTYCTEKLSNELTELLFKSFIVNKRVAPRLNETADLLYKNVAKIVNPINKLIVN